MALRIPVSLTHGSYHFSDLQHSSKEFYDKLSAMIAEYGFPDVSLKVASYSEGGLFSSKRDYLSIARKGYQFDICAAPFGKSFFVSWWLTETKKPDAWHTLKNTRSGGALAKQTESKTFYQMDTEMMFTESIRAILDQYIKDICEVKGIRMPEDERPKPSVLQKES